MGLTTKELFERARQNGTLTKEEFQELMQHAVIETQMNATVEMLQEYLNIDADAIVLDGYEEGVEARQELSNQVLDAMATEALYNAKENMIALDSPMAHRGVFYRYDPDLDPEMAISNTITSMALMGGRGMGANSAGSVIRNTLNSLGNVPERDELLSLSDEDLAKNCEGLLRMARISSAAKAVLEDSGLQLDGDSRMKLERLDQMKEALNITMQRMELMASPYYAQLNTEVLLSTPDIGQRAARIETYKDDIVAKNDEHMQNTPEQVQGFADYCKAVADLRGAMARETVRSMSDSMMRQENEYFKNDIFAPKTRYFTETGAMIMGANGEPAGRNSPELMAALQNGTVVATRAGVSTSFSLQASGTGMHLAEGTPSPEIARKQMQNINTKAIGDLLAGLDSGSSIFLAFTGSQQYKDMQTQMKAFRETFRGMESGADLSAEQRDALSESLQELYRTSYNYLAYKQDQRGDLTGAGRRYEATRIKAAKDILEFAERAAGHLDIYGKALTAQAELAAQPEPAKAPSVPDTKAFSSKDAITGNLMTYYGPMTTSDNPQVKTLANDIFGMAEKLGEYATSKGMTDQQKEEYRMVMAKMVTLERINREREVDPKRAGLIESMYKADPNGYLKTVLKGIPQADQLSIFELAATNHAQQVQALAAKGFVDVKIQNYYGTKAVSEPESPIGKISNEICGKANAITDFISNSKGNTYQKAEFRDVLTKMVAVDMLTQEKVGQENQVLGHPGVYESQYQKNPTGFFGTIENQLLRQGLDEKSMYEILAGNHKDQIRGISDSVQKGIIKEAVDRSQVKIPGKENPEKNMENDGMKPLSANLDGNGPKVPQGPGIGG